MSKLHVSIPCVLLGYPYRTIVFLREINGHKIAPLYSFSNLKLIEWGGDHGHGGNLGTRETEATLFWANLD